MAISSALSSSMGVLRMSSSSPRAKCCHLIKRWGTDSRLERYQYLVKNGGLIRGDYAMTLADALYRRYPHKSDRGRLLRERVQEACDAFLAGGYGDTNALQRLCSANDAQYWQQLSEVLVAHQLLKSGVHIEHSRVGPDFVFCHDAHRIWLEVICPEPKGLPEEWTDHVPGSGALHLPHESILLRWTAAFKEKAEKLLGKAGRGGYLNAGIVAGSDVYVIVINGRLLRGFNGAFPELTGISRFPYAVEASLAVGPLQVAINRTTMEATEKGHQHRPLIPKASGSFVPADTFFDPKFAAVSAIWAVDLDEASLLGEAKPMVVIHNPLATNSLAGKLLPAQLEYRAVACDEYYQLRWEDGRSV